MRNCARAPRRPALRATSVNGPTVLPHKLAPPVSSVRRPFDQHVPATSASHHAMTTKREASAEELTLQSVRNCYWHIWGNSLGSGGRKGYKRPRCRMAMPRPQEGPCPCLSGGGGVAQGLRPAAHDYPARTAQLLGGNSGACTRAIREGQAHLLGLQVRLPDRRNRTLQ